MIQLHAEHVCSDRPRALQRGRNVSQPPAAWPDVITSVVTALAMPVTSHTVCWCVSEYVYFLWCLQECAGKFKSF